jgi:hypothetical protein
MEPDERAGYASGPPVPEGQLVALFNWACAQLQDQSPGTSMLTGAAEVNSTAYAALNIVLDALAAEVDADTHRQLEHMFGALQSMIGALTPVEAGSPDAGLGDEGHQPATLGPASQGGWLRHRLSRLGGGGTQEAEAWERAVAGDPDAAADAAGAGVLAALAGALQHIEKAFDRHPEPPALPPQPWWEGRPRLLEAIADLFGVAAERHADETWRHADMLRDALRQEGIQVLFYDPEADPVTRADAFQLNDAARGAEGRYVTDRPALVTSDDGGRRIYLVQGKAQRLPAEGGQ